MIFDERKFPYALENPEHDTDNAAESLDFLNSYNFGPNYVDITDSSSDLATSTDQLTRPTTSQIPHSSSTRPVPPTSSPEPNPSAAPTSDPG